MARSKYSDCSASQARTRLDQAEMYLDVARIVIADETGQRRPLRPGMLFWPASRPPMRSAASRSGSDIAVPTTEKQQSIWRVSPETESWVKLSGI